jgi:hypothetical protein
VTPDDAGEYGDVAAVIVPQAIDISQFQPGERVALMVADSDTGPYQLQSIGSPVDDGPPDPTDNGAPALAPSGAPPADDGGDSNAVPGG